MPAGEAGESHEILLEQTMTRDVSCPIAWNEARIGIFLPTRGRPEMLRCLLDSLLIHTTRPDLLEVRVYVDLDDELTAQLVSAPSENRYPFRVSFARGPRTASQGEMYNLLWRVTDDRPDIVMYAGDKIVFCSPGWDETVREAFAESVSDGIGLVCPLDPWHTFHLGAFAFLGRPWIERMNRVFTEWFPFWLDDTWINQLAWMLGRRSFVPVFIGLQTRGKGGTIRLRNFSFWQRFFLETLPLREQEARFLADAMTPAESFEKELEPRMISCAAALRERHIPFLNERLSDEVMKSYDRTYLESGVTPSPEQVHLALCLQARAAGALVELLPDLCHQKRWEEVEQTVSTVMRGEFWSSISREHPDLVRICRYFPEAGSHASPDDKKYWTLYWEPLARVLQALGAQVPHVLPGRLELMCRPADAAARLPGAREGRAWRTGFRARIRLLWCLAKNARFLPRAGHWRPWLQAVARLAGFLAEDLNRLITQTITPFF